jgi:hypothetical protein
MVLTSLTTKNVSLGIQFPPRQATHLMACSTTKPKAISFPVETFGSNNKNKMKTVVA